MNNLTELEVINEMLLDIRLAPVATVDDVDIYHEATIARSVLRSKVRQVLSRRWNFNERFMELSPDIHGNINLPSATIGVTVPQGYDEVRMVDGKLVDSVSGDNVFTSSRLVNVTLGFPIEELPASIQNLCKAEARHSFISRMRSDAVVTSDIQKELQDAKALACSWDARQRRRNMLETADMYTHVDRNYPRS